MTVENLSNQIETITGTPEYLLNKERISDNLKKVYQNIRDNNTDSEHLRELLTKK